MQDRDLVMVADANNRGAVAALLRTLEGDESEPISRSLYRLDEKRLVEWRP